MWSKLLLLILFLSPVSFAATIQSRISFVEAPVGEEAIIFFENGRVGFVPATDTKLEDFQLAVEQARLLQVELDSELTLTSALTLAEVEPVGAATNVANYQATVLPDNRAASEVFSHLKTGWQEKSQCYNRAHVWAYEAHQRSGLKSIKLFLFFTSRYIRNYRFQWWFHVAPMTLISQNGKSYPKVLDRRYTSGPRDIQNWTNIFMKNDAVCPMIRKYSDYRKNQNAQDCFLFPASMYYYQPKDLENFERTGREKTSFIQSEVNWALREAF